MKTLYAFCLCFIISTLNAQEQMFVHTAIASTNAGNITIIDHPDLNDNPTAKLLITHNFNPAGSAGVYNDNVTGVRFNNVEQKWVIYNEDNTIPIVEDSSYNVYIAQGDEVFQHIHDAPTQPDPFYSYLDHPELNGSPSKIVVISNYWNPNGVPNNKKYGLFYDEMELRWVIYTENFTNPPNGVAFFVGVEGVNVQTLRHEATPMSISGNISTIDHPLLNNNPGAVLVLSHNWGIAGDSSNVVIDKNLGVAYDGANWGVHIEDQSAFPEDAKFDMFIFDTTLSITGFNEIEVTAFPNPTKNLVTLNSNTTINSVRIRNILGQELRTIYGNTTSLDVDLLNDPTGAYFLEIETSNVTSTLKVLKN